MFKDFLVGLFASVLWLVPPVLLVAAGGALVGLGFKFALAIVGWIGAALVLAGIVWGAVLYLMNGPVSW